MIPATQSDQVIEHRRGEFLLSTDPERLDVDVIHGFLSESYWAKGIPREVVARSIQNSLCFGVYANGGQIGFARVVSDYATYAYIGDVFVLPATKEFSVLATNKLGGLCLSTPAISDGTLYFRTTEKLVAIGTKSK